MRRPGIDEIPKFVIVEVYNAAVDCRNDSIVRKVHALKDPVVAPVHDIDGARVRRFRVIDHRNHGCLFIAGEIKHRSDSRGET